MNDTDRVLGELKEFKRRTIEELRDLRGEVRQIAHWRWKVTGGLTVVIALSELVNVFLRK